MTLPWPHQSRCQWESEAQQSTVLLPQLSALPHASCLGLWWCCCTLLLPLQHPHSLWSHPGSSASPSALCPFAVAGACTAAPTRGDGKHSSDSSPTKPNGVLGRGRFLSARGARLAPMQSPAAAHGTAPLAPAMGRAGGFTAGAAGCFGKRGAHCWGVMLLLQRARRVAKRQLNCGDAPAIAEHLCKGQRGSGQVGDADESCGAGKTSNSLPVKLICFTLSHPCRPQTCSSAPALAPGQEGSAGPGPAHCGSGRLRPLVTAFPG